MQVLEGQVAGRVDVNAKEKGGDTGQDGFVVHEDGEMVRVLVRGQRGGQWRC